jgi:hypothetical protein
VLKGEIKALAKKTKVVILDAISLNDLSPMKEF